MSVDIIYDHKGQKDLDEQIKAIGYKQKILQTVSKFAKGNYYPFVNLDTVSTLATRSFSHSQDEQFIYIFDKAF